MRKLYVLFTFLIFSSLILVSCQNSSDVTSPADTLDKPVSIVWGPDPAAVNIPVPGPGASTNIDLVAGQNMVVGYVNVVRNGSNLDITYHTNGWNITETHLMVVAHPQNFTVNNSGNPKVGQFPFGGTGLSGNYAGPYSVPIPSGLVNNMVYIGAHAVVDGGGTVSEFVCQTYPEQASLTPLWLPSGQPYTVRFAFDYTSDIFYGFCLDNTRYISGGGSAPRTVRFICSYDEMPACSTFIEKPENLDLVNWIINHRESTWGRNTVQAAIWELINPSGTLENWQDPNGPNYWNHNPLLREQIVQAAQQNGEGYIPECGDSVLVIVYGPGDICSPEKQVVGMIAPVDCVSGNSGSETAWAFNYPIDNTSTGFPGANWFRYFGYNVGN